MDSIRFRVFQKLDQNPLLSPKFLCTLLKLPYANYRNYITKLRSEWKQYHKIERGSKCSSHCVRGWVDCVVLGDRGLAVGVGWVLSRSRNRFLFWRDRLGRLVWYESGRVSFWVRRPASEAKVKQLMCNGFAWTGLIADNRVLMAMLDAIRFKGAHDVYATDQRLPYMRIEKYRDSNGIVIKLGDRTHPNAVEVEFSYPDWAERNERLLSQVLGILGNQNQPTAKHLAGEKLSYVS